MRKMPMVFFICAFILDFGVYFAGADESRVCRGPRGDNSFTIQEFLDLVTIKAVTPKDGHEAHYAATWPCNDADHLYHFIVYPKDIESLKIFTQEKSYLSGKVPRISLWVDLVLASQTKTVSLPDKKQVDLYLSVTTSGIPLQMPVYGDGTPKLYQEYRGYYNLFNQAVRMANKTKVPIILDVEAWLELTERETCPIHEGDQSVNAWISVPIHFGVPERVSVGGKIIWENKTP